MLHHSKKSKEVNARIISLQRILFELHTPKEVRDEIHEYMHGMSHYSTSCFGRSHGGIKSRIAPAFNLGLFKNLQNDPTIKFENLSRKEKKHLIAKI